MQLKSGKGYALALVMMFAIIIMIASIGFYNSVRHISIEAGIEEVHNTKGYYLSLAGLRYVAILLKDPDILVFDVNNQYVVTGTELDGVNLYTDLEIDPSQLIITITRIIAGPQVGEYSVSATYSR